MSPSADNFRSNALHYSVFVLSYNQEAFVGDAIRSVLAQECDPVEIIISDDCSIDGTFDSIRAAVQGYDGPHNIQVRRNTENLGLVAHINLIVELASGDVIIPAYGDDISLPTRVAEIAEVFESHQPWLVHSDAIAIDEAGAETQSKYRKADFFRTTDPLETATSMSLFLGASGAWHRALFDKYGPISFANVYDDLTLGFRAALEDGVAFIEKPLIQYREGVGLSHQLNRERNPEQAASDRRKKILEATMSTYRQRLKDATTFGLDQDHPIVRKLSTALLKARMRRACHEGIARMMLHNMRHPGLALSAAAAEGLRILQRR